MTNDQNPLDEVIRALKQDRDELKLKMHLAGMDAQDEYDRVSGKLDDLAAQYEPVKDAVEETAESVFTALGMVADELKFGLSRVRKAIDESD